MAISLINWLHSFCSVQHGHEMVANLLAETCPKVLTMADLNGMLSTHWACVRGYPKLSILELSVIDIADGFGRTPAMLAASSGNLQCLQVVDNLILLLKWTLKPLNWLSIALDFEYCSSKVKLKAERFLSQSTPLCLKRARKITSLYGGQLLKKDELQPQMLRGAPILHSKGTD